MAERRLAVLVDGDNMSAKFSSQLLVEAGKVGRTDVARVYAAANRPSDWLSMPGYRLMHAGTGKNAADLLLSIDAMELALVGGVEGFAIATSDGDFTHLAQRLRERGLYVLGLGEEKAPNGFRLSCTEFLSLSCSETCAKSRGECRFRIRSEDPRNDRPAQQEGPWDTSGRPRAQDACGTWDAD